MSKRSIIFILCVIMIISFKISAQENQGAQSTTQQGQVLDLGEIRIDARVELPQVQIFDRRITPAFDDVRAEKSFKEELSAKAEAISFEAITSGKIEKINNINSLLNKNRF